MPRTRAGSFHSSPAGPFPIAGPLAIVDVETTGQSAAFGRVIEVAVIRLEQGRVVERFQSLLNPERFISPMIQGLTGISNEDVETAPKFRKVAKRLRALLDGAVFVAHNARFDYSFIKAEFQRLGIPYNAKCLCTVKLSRKLFPEHRHHDLSSLIRRHGLECESRHRAAGDAEAVLDFLRKVGESAPPDRIEKVLKDILKSGALPAGVDRGMIDELPETPGVYLFYGKQGELLYVGKSINIRDRVRAHFVNGGQPMKELAMTQQVDRVDHRRTAGELGALLLESRLIKELTPLYNSASRQRRKVVVARKGNDRRGYATVELEEIDRILPGESDPILGVFTSMKQAKEFLVGAARSHQLCHRLTGLEQGKSYCFSYHLKQCRGACMGDEPVALYNERVEQAFARRRVRTWPYSGGIAINEPSAEGGWGEVFLVDNWCLMSSFRYSDSGQEGGSAGEHRFDYDSYKILARYILANPRKRNIKPLPRPDFDRLLSSVEPSLSL